MLLIFVLPTHLCLFIPYNGSRAGVSPQRRFGDDIHQIQHSVQVGHKRHSYFAKDISEHRNRFAHVNFNRDFIAYFKQ